MSTTLTVFVVVLTAISSITIRNTHSYTSIQKVKDDSSHPNMCYDDDKTWHPLGSTWQINCEEHSCNELKNDKDYNLFIQIDGCIYQVMEGKDCKEKPVDYNVKYPDCCPIHCVHSNTNGL